MSESIEISVLPQESISLDVADAYEPIVVSIAESVSSNVEVDIVQNEPMSIDVTFEEPNMNVEVVIGSIGTRGPEGPSGADGYTPIKGIDYFDGTDGLSAYEIALLDGFIGTETEWLASLIGLQGPSGTDGSDGVDGYTPIKGIDYFDGVQGQQGADGYTPVKGIDYFDGEQGPKGDDGYTPIKGVDYFDGLDGSDGASGEDGKSAYEIALLNGFVGTEAEWLTSLIGPQGEIGPAGSDATVTKANVEAVLTGEITTHTHPSSGDADKIYGCFSLGTGGATALSSTEKTLVINQTDINQRGMTLSANGVTPNKAGDYKITLDCYLNNSSTSRVEYSIYLKKNGTEIPRTRSAVYQRGYDSGQSSTINTIQSLLATDTITAHVILTDGATSSGYQDDNGTRLILEEK